MRILITGATGMLGATLVDKWQNKYDVFSTGKNNFPENPAKNFMPFNLLNKSYRSLIDWASPEVILHCAAITNLETCQKYPSKTIKVNADSVKKFLLSDNNARMIFISSDAVFPEGVHMANEKHVTKPLNVYGKSKIFGEEYIQNTGKPHCTIRTTIVGKNINAQKKGFVEWIIKSVSSGREITLFDDVVFTPITIWHFADALQWIIDNDFSGKIHISGKELVSKFDFGFKICKQLGLDTNLIKRGKIDDISFKAKRVKDQTLDSNYYETISGRNLPTTKQTINQIIDNFKLNN